VIGWAAVGPAVDVTPIPVYVRGRRGSHPRPPFGEGGGLQSTRSPNPAAAAFFPLPLFLWNGKERGSAAFWAANPDRFHFIPPSAISGVLTNYRRGYSTRHPTAVSEHGCCGGRREHLTLRILPAAKDEIERSVCYTASGRPVDYYAQCSRVTIRSVTRVEGC